METRRKFSCEFKLETVKLVKYRALLPDRCRVTLTSV
jgi:hypothetical protein